jgi:enoyl-CoA hydratase/carnithine racemase
MTAFDELGGVRLEGFRFEVLETTALITIDRPESGNSLTSAMRDGITAIWREVASNPEIRAAVITGAGERHFCTGIDVRAAASSGGTTTGMGPAASEIVWSPLHHGVWKPVICALNGTVAGGGLHFVADADVIVAAEHVELLDTHVDVGMVGAVENVGLTHRLPLGTVLRMTMWGKQYRLTATRAHALGLLDEVYPSSELLPAALALAASVRSSSPAAVALSKQALWASLGRPRADAEEYAWALARMHRSHPDFREGGAAFAERRPPRWQT